MVWPQLEDTWEFSRLFEPGNPKGSFHAALPLELTAEEFGAAARAFQRRSSRAPSSEGKRK